MNTVLLIDDSEMYRHSIIRLFSGDTYQFLEATSPVEGIATLDANPQIGVVLLDLSFDNGSGMEVLDHIRERSDSCRVIVLTAHENLLPATQADSYDVFNYLPKATPSSSHAIRFSVEQAFKDLQREYLYRKTRYLVEVQKSINENHPLTETLDLICRSVLSTVGAYTCHIRMYDHSRGDYHLAGYAGAAELRQAFERPRTKGEAFSGIVAETAQAQVLHDLQRVPEFLVYKTNTLARERTPTSASYFDDVRSAYIVPISTGLSGGAVDAVLNVSSATLGFFDDERRELVDEFVTQATLAITKDWLQRKRNEIHLDYTYIGEMLTEMSGGLKGTSADLLAVYDVVTRRISQIVNPEVVSVFLFNSTTEHLEKVAERRGTDPIYVSRESYARGQGLTGYVFESEETLQLPDQHDVRPLEHPRYDRESDEGGDIPSGSLEHYLGVPIKIGNRVRGVLRAMNKKSKYYDVAALPTRALAGHDRRLLERGFSPDSRNVLEIAANHLALALRNAELLKDKDYQVEQIRTLGAVGRLINSALDLDEVLRLTIQEMSVVMHAKICMLFLKDGDDRIVLRQSFGMAVRPEMSYSLGEGITGSVAATGHARLIVNTERPSGKYDSEIRAAVADGGDPQSIESLMAVPIVTRGTILGVMKVINRVGDNRQYDERDLDLFRTFAEYVGVAIENARNYHDLSRLVSAVAHEINNTSGVIPANVTSIKARLGRRDDSVNRMLDRIENAANQATEFANEIAGFSANRSGEKRAMDINEIIRSTIDALDFVRLNVPEVISLELSLYKDPLVCEIYERPFTQIVRNILINAFQALERKDGGAVSVSTSPEAGERPSVAVIRFEDNGPGIRTEHRARIFDFDFTTKPRGNGVGLWLVRTQLQVIGGTIDVESEFGIGARFIVRIPLSPGTRD